MPSLLEDLERKKEKLKERYYKLEDELEYQEEKLKYLRRERDELREEYEDYMHRKKKTLEENKLLKKKLKEKEERRRTKEAFLRQKNKELQQLLEEKKKYKMLLAEMKQRERENKEIDEECRKKEEEELALINEELAAAKADLGDIEVEGEDLETYVGESDTSRECLMETYDFEASKFVSKKATIRIAKKAFASGNFRSAFRAEILVAGSRIAQKYVVKKYKDAPKKADIEEDVKIQEIAADFAKKFNSHKPKKTISILKAAIITIGKEIFSGEPYQSGMYIKHNNNKDYVRGGRNTPQAFSHFTYEASGEKLMVVDVQGVGDTYTDLQILSSDGKGYGQGNLGKEGIDAFFDRHICNPVCLGLKLKVRQNASKIITMGTVLKN